MFSVIKLLILWTVGCTLYYTVCSLFWEINMLTNVCHIQDRQTFTAEFPSQHASFGRCPGRQWHPAPTTWLQCSSGGDEQDTTGPRWTARAIIRPASSANFYNDCSWCSAHPQEQYATQSTTEQTHWMPSGGGCTCSSWHGSPPLRTRV